MTSNSDWRKDRPVDILAIENDATSLLTINYLISHVTTYQLETAFSYPEGLAKIYERQPKLVLLAHGLSERSGTEFVSSINKKFPQIRIIVLLLADDRDLEKAYRRVGAYQCISKSRPYFLENLRKLMIDARFAPVSSVPVGRTDGQFVLQERFEGKRIEPLSAGMYMFYAALAALGFLYEYWNSFSSVQRILVGSASLILGLLSIAWAIGFRLWQPGLNKKYLPKLCMDLFLGDPVFEKGKCFYTSLYKRRNTNISYQFSGGNRTLEIQLSLTQKFWLRLIKESPGGSSEEITLNDPDMDNRFRIFSDRPEAASEFLRSPEVRNHLLDIPLDYFEIYRGNAKLLILQPQKIGLDRLSFETTLRHLLEILNIYEEQRLQIILATVHTSGAICPYCREPIDSGTMVLVRCSKCDTVHHKSCWEENKECTTWGCFSTRYEPIQADSIEGHGTLVQSRLKIE